MSQSFKKVILYLPILFFSVLILWISAITRELYDGQLFEAIQSITQQPLLLIEAIPLSIQWADALYGVWFGFLLFLFLMEKRKNRKKYKKGVEHGSARWGTKQEIKPYIDPIFKNNVILSETEYLTMNSRPKDWRTGRNKNVLIIGGAGSGKTRNYIKPNIMQMHSSYVVTDPKGTILNEVGLMLARNGYKIKVLNLINFEKSMRYNPLAYVKNEQDILKVAETIIENTKGEGKSGDEFWVKAEKLLYQAFIGAIIYEFPDYERNLNSLMEMLVLSEVRENDETYKNSVDLWFDDLEKKNPSHFAVKQYRSYKNAAGKTAKSILISCAARLSAFNIPKLAELISEDEMQLDTIGDRKTALFVIIPDTDSTFNFVASMMYTQMFNMLATKADDVYGGRLPVHIRFLLDEFANIGKIPQFEKLIATIRSREMSASIVLQAKSQLKAIYKDHTDTIVGNCDTQIFLGGQEKGTLEDLSKSLGKETIDDYNTSESRGSSQSKNQNYSKIGRELMSIDELASMDRSKCIVQISGLRPFFSQKYDIAKHPEYKKWHAQGTDDPRWFKTDAYIDRIHKHQLNSVEDLKRKLKGKHYTEITNTKTITFEFEGDEVVDHQEGW